MNIEVKTDLINCMAIGRNRAQNFDMLHLWIDRGGNMYIDVSQTEGKVHVGRISLDSVATKELLQELERGINDQRYNDSLS